MSISTVLLDVGGVILDESEHEAVRAGIACEILSALKPAYSIEDYYADIEEAVAAFCPQTYRYVFWKHLNPDLDLFRKTYDSYSAQWRERRPPLRLYPEIGEEIQALYARFNLVIAGQYGKEILNLLQENGLSRYFSTQLTQDDFDITKPDPRYYERIAQTAADDPKCCVMVGDRIDKDVIPAKQVGMKTIRIRVGLHSHQQPRTPDEIPDAELPNVTGLAQAVKALADK